MYRMIGLSLMALLGLAAPPLQQGIDPLEEFLLEDCLGIAYASQIVEFTPRTAFARNASLYVLDEAGNRLPHQILSNGHLAVFTGLAARQTKRIRVYNGSLAGSSSPSTWQPVSMVERGPQLEIDNGRIAVRLQLRAQSASDLQLAPVQGLRRGQDAWTANGPNFLYAFASGVSEANPYVLRAKSFRAQIVEQGPLLVQVRLEYTFNRPSLSYGSNLIRPAGEGFYRSTISLGAGDRSILLEEHTDMEMQYYLPTESFLSFDRARYRGHSATSVELGREPDGRVYRPNHERSAMDAEIDVPVTVAAVSGATVKPLVVWNPWASNHGWYWQCFAASAAPTSPLTGIFAGPASRALGASHSQAGVYWGKIPQSGNFSSGFTFRASTRYSQSAAYAEVRLSWGIFLGTKETNLAEPTRLQGINREMNRRSGINLNKMNRYQLDAGGRQEAGFWGTYLSAAALEKLSDRLRSDSVYFQEMIQKDPYSKELLTFLRSPTLESSNLIAARILGEGRAFAEDLVNGEGIYSHQYHYWLGGLVAARAIPYLNVLLLRTDLSADLVAQLRSLAAFYGGLLWDDDFAPLFNSHGLNLGTANMPVQQFSYRNQYAVFLGASPAYSERASELRRNGATTLQAEVNSHGAHRAAMHYIGASLSPLLSLWLQLKSLGAEDPFATEPRMALLGNFLLQSVTPPEPRFGGLRKLPAFGDSATESSELFGLLGTGLADSHPALSRQLMGAWREQGKPHSSFTGTTILKIDDSLPSERPYLSDQSFPGYHTILRHGDPSAESALWLLHGDYYSDHRHDDSGSLTLYLLGAPISLDWGSLYAPQVATNFQHATLLPETLLESQAWDASSSSLTGKASQWKSIDTPVLQSFGHAAQVSANYSSAPGGKWTRTLRVLRYDPDYPVVWMRDQWEPLNSSRAMLWSLPLMATGPVDVKGEIVNPPLRTFLESSPQLPSAIPAKPLPAGLHPFRFTGQWGVDWDLFVDNAEPMQYTLGNWGHKSHPTAEMVQFQGAQGREFEERQHIIRFRARRGFDTILVARKKNRAAPTVTKDGGMILVQMPNGGSLQIGQDHALWQKEQLSVLNVFTPGSVLAYGSPLSQGSVELMDVGGEAYLQPAGGFIQPLTAPLCAKTQDVSKSKAVLRVSRQRQGVEVCPVP